jgi:type II secretory pathway pseudopilin PulG
MFSLIIAIIAVALVVAVIALGGYFGGDSLTQGQAKAQAAQLISEERQILASMDMFQADNQRWPTSLDELVAGGYLRSIPAGVTLGV